MLGTTDSVKEEYTWKEEYNLDDGRCMADDPMTYFDQDGEAKNI